ncbi:unnamed protein product, partial [Didymodactylos carnosus]
DDPAFLEAQNRLRYGQCTTEDHKLLSTRVIGRQSCPVKSLDGIEWKEAPVLVFRNDLRTELNNLAVISTPREIGVVPVVCIAHDTFNAGSAVNEKLRKFVLRLSDNKTKGLCSYLFLVIGMPLLLTDNLATELRLSNATIGDFPPDTMFMRKPLYALVEIQKPNISSKLDTLPQKLVPRALVEETFEVECKELLSEEERRKRMTKIKLKGSAVWSVVKEHYGHNNNKDVVSRWSHKVDYDIRKPKE